MTEQNTGWRDISTFDYRMFSLMTAGTPDRTEVVKYKGDVPSWATHWQPLPPPPGEEVDDE